MRSGTVKWFNEDKGYGFITPDNGNGKDDFVHIRAVEQSGLKTLKEGDRVEYDMEESRGKMSAIKITKI